MSSSALSSNWTKLASRWIGSFGSRSPQCVRAYALSVVRSRSRIEPGPAASPSRLSMKLDRSSRRRTASNWCDAHDWRSGTTTGIPSMIGCSR